MFERLLVCEFAVADLTTRNPNVLYELGIRHAGRPRTTALAFDVNLLRHQPYQLEADNELSELRAEEQRQAVARHLRELSDLGAREPFTDSPLFQLISGWKP
jgi:hypothetical protein